MLYLVHLSFFLAYLLYMYILPFPLMLRTIVPPWGTMSRHVSTLSSVSLDIDCTQPPFCMVPPVGWQQMGLASEAMEV